MEITMSATAQLLAVFKVEKRLDGLQSRLRAAQRFLDEQDKQHGSLSATLDSLKSQSRQLEATAGEREGEVKRLDERIEQLRERMNTSQTNKEYQALLSEMNTLKSERDAAESEALSSIEKRDEIAQQISEFESKTDERAKVRDVAAGDRDSQANEIAAKVKELEAERDRLAAEVPAPALAILKSLLRDRGDEAMAAIELMDKRRHETCCGSCMMTLPVEILNSLLRSELTRCANCGCLLYIEEDVAEQLQPASKR